MEHYLTFLLMPAVVGAPIQIAVLILDDYSAPFVPFFSFALAVWAVFMLEFWKRREKSIALAWGMTDFEDTEQERADLRAEFDVSYIDGSKNFQKIDTTKQWRAFAISFIVVVWNDID
mmetsp:Transcript_16100/g.23456  ORF Transcript_16100/g.23456 Transcript_16100/m.23456 type:complete len:118 (-) Transcript_16100:443-796(-)